MTQQFSHSSASLTHAAISIPVHSAKYLCQVFFGTIFCLPFLQLLFLVVGEMSLGRQEAFEIFRRDYEHNDTINDNKQTLKQRYIEAKGLGEQVNRARTKISESRLYLTSQGRRDSGSK